MKGSLLRNLSFCARRLRLSAFNHNPNLTPSLLSLSASTRSTPRLFCSGNNLPDQPDFTQTQNKRVSVDVDDVSNEELKRRVAKLREGDAEAIPSVFEAILLRYLSGKPIEADQELMREILGKGEGSEDDDDEDDDDLESDFEEVSDTDDEVQHFDLHFDDEAKTKR